MMGYSKFRQFHIFNERIMKIILKRQFFYLHLNTKKLNSIIYFLKGILMEYHKMLVIYE